ncbi:MAG: SpoVR family protein [Pseudomonadota bacterium]
MKTVAQLEEFARAQGLDFFPVHFERVPPSFMMEVSVYGLPVRMPHWSFGVRYIYQLIQHRMGHSHIFEVVFPGNPGKAYLADTNSEVANVLVAAHVLGHADFSKNNYLFRKVQEEVGYHIVEQAAAHAKMINDIIDRFGETRVEAVLDAALALEQHIDMDLGLRRELYPRQRPEPQARSKGEFQRRFEELGGHPPAKEESPEVLTIPPHPESDLLWFIAHYAPEMEPWERDIFLAVREESFYFYPVFACQIMNEGWASYWHARLLRDSDFLTQNAYVDAMKTHSDVVRPYANKEQVSLAINPYHLGYVMWEKLIEREGLDAARRVMSSEDDFSFLRNYLDEDLARELELFQYTAAANGEITVTESTLESLLENILSSRYNYGAPKIAVAEMKLDGTLVLVHDHKSDGRGLKLDAARRVLNYIKQVWRRPVLIHTVNGVKKGICLSSEEVVALED